MNLRSLVKVGLWLTGYGCLIFGVLLLIGTLKMLLDVLPDLVIGEGVGLGLTVFGLWLLGKHNKMSIRRIV